MWGSSQLQATLRGARGSTKLPQAAARAEPRTTGSNLDQAVLCGPCWHVATESK